MRDGVLDEKLTHDRYRHLLLDHHQRSRLRSAKGELIQFLSYEIEADTVDHVAPDSHRYLLLGVVPHLRLDRLQSRSPDHRRFLRGHHPSHCHHPTQRDPAIKQGRIYG